jgi:hypothetical protein
VIGVMEPVSGEGNRASPWGQKWADFAVSARADLRVRGATSGFAWANRNSNPHPTHHHPSDRRQAEAVVRCLWGGQHVVDQYDAMVAFIVAHRVALYRCRSERRSWRPSDNGNAGWTPN